MPKRKSGYEEMLEDVIETLKHSPDEVNNVLETSGKVISAANDMTKDELALISAYVKADLKEFADNYEESKSGPFTSPLPILFGKVCSKLLTEPKWNGLNCLKILNIKVFTKRER